MSSGKLDEYLSRIELYSGCRSQRYCKLSTLGWVLMPPRIKGASLINTIGILREVLGPVRFATLLAACPPETQQLIRRTLVAVEWVSLEVWSPFVQAIYEHLCRRDEHAFRRLMAAVCKRDFTTVYRSLIHLIPPLEILAKSSSLWAAYMDGGSLTVVSSDSENGRRRLTLQLQDLESSYPLHTTILHAYLEQILHMSGAKDCSVRRLQEEQRAGKLYCSYCIELKE
jgi:hypothetical protein